MKLYHKPTTVVTVLTSHSPIMDPTTGEQPSTPEPMFPVPPRFNA